ncbi:hypothetical protein PoB_005893500 [Plakobranchus ocellatus]|uniref:Uncharacterized protein n=1 Tax=Plakobranchus ocellatus TaxID=259542 RepID=A0AAV4CL64_9GAST|nr:hypothetical protein PoB_005893500 [Plakobranchus ocellatus]
MPRTAQELSGEGRCIGNSTTATGRNRAHRSLILVRLNQQARPTMMMMLVMINRKQISRFHLLHCTLLIDNAFIRDTLQIDNAFIRDTLLIDNVFISGILLILIMRL